MHNTGFSHKATKVVRMAEFGATLPQNEPIVFVVGGMAHGSIEVCPICRPGLDVGHRGWVWLCAHDVLDLGLH